MVKTGLLLTDPYSLISVAAILDVFETVNRFCGENGQIPVFSVTLFSMEPEFQGGLHPLFHLPVKSIREENKMDLLIIPAFKNCKMDAALHMNAGFIPWLKDQYLQGAEIASFCTGSFLLAATGMLNNRPATTHVDACTDFSRAFPAVHLMADKTVTEDQHLYTSGGATFTFQLLLHLIKRICGLLMAVKTAKYYAIDMDRDKQTCFSTFNPLKVHDDLLVARAQQKIENHFQDSSSIEEIIKDIPSSRRNIGRRFKQILGMSPMEYLQQTRMEAAKSLLIHTTDQMTQIIFSTGYSDPKAFRRLFRKSVGMTPSEYRIKFRVN